MSPHLLKSPPGEMQFVKCKTVGNSILSDEDAPCHAKRGWIPIKPGRYGSTEKSPGEGWHDRETLCWKAGQHKFENISITGMSRDFAQT
jgi:hypothetical protein